MTEQNIVVNLVRHVHERHVVKHVADAVRIVDEYDVDVDSVELHGVTFKDALREVTASYPDGGEDEVYFALLQRIRAEMIAEGRIAMNDPHVLRWLTYNRLLSADNTPAQLVDAYFDWLGVS